MAIENLLSADRLNGLFEGAAELQANKTLMFSTVAELMPVNAMNKKRRNHVSTARVPGKPYVQVGTR